MSVKQTARTSEIDEKLAALMTNARAIKAVAAAVEGTIGPKGLDTMLVDGFNDVVITNAGVTILEKMDVTHPAARMLINIAKAQQAEIGDGTTTATVMAGALVSEGVDQVVKGVPVARVIEGIKLGIKEALKAIKEKAFNIKGLEDPVLTRIAYIAGREHKDIAELIVKAAKMIGEDKFQDEVFKLADTVIAEEGAENEVFSGVIIDKKRLNRQMPLNIEDAKILIIDDALKPEELEEEALATEMGFKRYMELKNKFTTNLHKLVELGVNVVLVDRAVDNYAEEFLTDAGVLVCTRVGSKDLRIVSEHTGARLIKRTGLNKDITELKEVIGKAKKVYEDVRLKKVRIIEGYDKPMATVLVGAATSEVVDERERIAKDAASSVQAAIKGGYVAGGGSVELAVSRSVETLRETVKGMAAYGVDCVSRALRKPVFQIILNAGFNPLEKLEDITAAQIDQGNECLAIDCDSGDIVDMKEMGVFDPLLVKYHAIKAAGEIAEAILRIDTIIKMKSKKDSGEMNPNFNF
ncbi:TCP-1/cpn60 chaperonin family protein [Clostridium sp. 'deep sea']|uniref:TCP-1/cpn60 chaperonin family protein n=1 Tax=Clostridium sp. 'deep sea' TaxID=2779445 RepID=UPI001896A42F|nr:TCP-1/cpn60 chaperonin family protein [Clostridium sp. 'deep sea']QOR35582.1 TCP-1/cpn60 chaperonin family protein [Clostridium sp. 'deep sea']